ncbi:MAG TPA: hypothetical protein VIM31_04605 [Candidatus Microsaccharimonas sp.]|jgi:hypothetical protein
MKLRAKNVVIGITLSLMLTVTFVPQLFAEDGTSGSGTTTTTPSTSTDSSSGSGKSTESTKRSQTQPSSETDKSGTTQTAEDKADNPKGEVRKEITRQKLDDKKKAVCETHQSVVNKAMDDVVQRSKNHFDRITAIYDMTTKFYTDKGLSVSNYDTLVANVETAKAAAVSASAELTSTPQFSCASDGPKADIQAFRNKRLDKVDAFGAYRDAVKVLVKAVRDAAKATETTTTSGTTTGGTN